MLIKVCGMRDPENIRQVAELGIDWMGFIFYPKSPRCIIDNGENYQLSIINYQFPKRIGVFVNASPEQMMKTAQEYALDYLQLHGNETPDECFALHKRGYSLIKAFSIATAEDLEKTVEYEGRVDYFLFDTKCEGYGGSGQQFDWSVLDAYRGETPFLLSGGIRPESLEALKTFHHPRLAGIDLNSGFETSPGLKDVERLRLFINDLKESCCQ